MRQMKSLFLLFLAAAFLLCGAKTAEACSCGPLPTVLDSFQGAQDVIIAEVTAVEKTSESDLNNYPYGVKGAKMSVKKVFKGNLKAGDEIFFEQGGGADCIETYREESIGAKLLIYDTPENGKRAIMGCGRSGGLGGATEDLLYLENMDKRRGKTRVSGRASYGFSSTAPKGQSNAGKKIRIIGKNKTYTAITDENGVYEIYDLPAGDYFIAPEIADGWKINRYMLRYSPSLPFYGLDESDDLNRFPVVLEAGKHASVNFMYEVDNAIQGRVLDPEGNPMKGICVTAVKTDVTEFKYGPSGCADEKGIFTITELYAESYVLVINGDGKISADEPTERLFYPGVQERSKAAVVNVGEGKKVRLPDFRVANIIETLTISGVLTFADGTPAQSEKVQFVADKEEASVAGEPYDYTNKLGEFSIKIFKGQTGKIRAEMIFGARHLESCTDLKKAVIENNIGGSITASTAWTDIKGDKDMKDIELIFPFPKCEKE